MLRTILRRLIIFPILCFGCLIVQPIGLLIDSRKNTNDVCRELLFVGWFGIKEEEIETIYD